MEEQENDYKELLILYNNLRSDNQKKKNAGIHDYSLINALLKKTDEVNLHSNFIYSMINPNSAHYYDNKFLEFFLESININNFINLDNAKVHKEVGKIDLLIEDGKNVIIIENKLRAVDQPSQINRYILYTIKKYLDGQKNLLSENVHIVYLSEYKSEPSPKSKSIQGFILDKDFLTWSGIPIAIQESNTKNTVKLDLDKGTKIKFKRVKHSKELNTWTKKSIEYLKNKPNSEALIYAFNEYTIILKRLDTKQQWRNLMSLDEYMIDLDESEQNKMYIFMNEANKKIDDYHGKKMYETIKKHFLEKEECNSLNSEKEFDEISCIKWFKKKGTDYKNIGFEYKKNGKNYIFELATEWIYFGTGLRYDKNNRIGHKKNNNFFDLLKKIKTLNK